MNHKNSLRKTILNKGSRSLRQGVLRKSKEAHVEESREEIQGGQIMEGFVGKNTLDFIPDGKENFWQGLK